MVVSCPAHACCVLSLGQDSQETQAPWLPAPPAPTEAHSGDTPHVVPPETAVSAGHPTVTRHPLPQHVSTLDVSKQKSSGI